jgi:hypothetical protein
MKLLLMFTFLLGILGCEQKQIASDFYEKAPESQVTKSVDRASRSGIGYGSGYGSSPEGQNSINVDKKISDIQQMLIRKASLRFEVKKYDDSRKKILDIIKASNAYVANESESRNEYQISNSMIIRVPQSNFDNLIDSIIYQCKNLDDRSINVSDVTEEYVDTDSRLKAKREIESRYLEILKKAQNVKEILEVEQNLGGIREEIESAEGRLKYLSHQVSFSTIELMFYQKTNVILNSRIGFISRIYSSFISGWNGLIEFIIGLISIWPFLAVLTGITGITIRLIKRHRAVRKNTKSL